MSFERSLAAVLLLVAGCAGHLDHPERFRTDGGGGGTDGSTCGDVPSTLLVPTCGRAGCHAAAQPANGLDLATSGQGARMVGKAATGGPGLLIDPSNPDNSVVLLKVSATPPFGSRMPLAGTPLDAPTVQCLHDWVVSQVSSPPDMANGASDAGADLAGSD